MEERRKTDLDGGRRGRRRIGWDGERRASREEEDGGGGAGELRRFWGEDYRVFYFAPEPLTFSRSMY